ncbi:MAG TPA: EAL domain-containing protein [Gemmatimonadaceae bacterium]|nr:EAL domain-containing protein [Gemmatimonadaceae bacterium]
MALDRIPVPLAPARTSRALSRPVWVILAAVGFAVTLIGGNAVARARFRHLRALALGQWEQQLTANAELTSSVIDAWLDERRIDAREASGYVAAYAELEGAAVNAPNRAVAKTAAHSALVWALTTLRRRHSYQSVWAVDDSGRIVAAADGSDTLTDAERHAAMDMHKARRERIVGPALLPSGNARLSLIMPVAGTAWSTVVAISPGPALFPYVMRETGGTATSRTKLIARDAADTMLYRVLSPSAYPPSEPFGLSVRRQVAPLVWILAAHGVDTAGLFTDIRGGSIVAATTHVPGAGWGVVRAIDEEEAIAGAVTRFRTEAAIVVGALSVLIVIVAATLIDADKRRRAAARIARLARANELILDSVGEGIVGLDLAGRAMFCNRAAARMLGYEPKALLEQALHPIVHPTDSTARHSGGHCPIETALRDGNIHRVDDDSFRRADGTTFYVAYESTPIRENGAVVGAVIAFRDVSERKRLEAQLTHQAFHDALTGLANRALFRDRVEHALTRTERHASGVAVLFLDLDNFKAINDGLGHAAGDRLLCAVAGRLMSATRGHDTVARLGGDEFAILLEAVHDDAEALAVVERVEAAMRAPVQLDAKDVIASASIGIARGGSASRADELLRNADVAMYRAKARGGASHAVFVPEMHAALLDRLELEADLRRAVEREEFRLVYQPIVELSTTRCVGVEALVRWNHSERGQVMPAEFITLAEESGLIVPLGRWVLQEACRRGAKFVPSADGSEPLSISVNISGKQLQHPGLADDVMAALEDSGLAPERLVLEITESVIMQDTESTLRKLRSLKSIGIRLAIDDFGTGYSSLSYLQRFPIDILKLDKTFIDGVGRGGTDAALARTIIALGDMLHLRTVAEGVETIQQRDELLAYGCDLAQGYVFAKPLEADVLDTLINRVMMRDRVVTA